MESSGTSRLLVVGSTMGAATAVRIGRIYAQTVRDETSKLLKLWLDACDPEPEPDARRKFREEVIEVARTYATQAWTEIQKGISDTDGYAASRREREEKVQPPPEEPGQRAPLAR
jgi:hypothetical protein